MRPHFWVLTISDGLLLAPRGVHNKRRTCSPTDVDRHDAHDGHDGNVDMHNLADAHDGYDALRWQSSSHRVIMPSYNVIRSSTVSLASKISLLTAESVTLF